MTSPAEFQRRFNLTDEQNTSDFQKAMDAHRAKAQTVRERANETIQRISERRDLTPEAKQTAAAKVYKPAAEELNQMLDQHIAKVQAHKQQLARKAFGADTVADPRASREARQMASQVQDAREATEMIRNAQFDGDKQLARAMAGIAFERGWHDAVDVWNADGSNNAYMRHVVELVQMPDTSSAAWRLQVAQDYTGPMPGCLDGLKPHEITRAAEADYGTGDAA